MNDATCVSMSEQLPFSVSYQVVGHQREARMQVHLIQCFVLELLINKLVLVVEDLQLLRGRASQLLHFLLHVPERLVICGSGVSEQHAHTQNARA